MPEQLIAESTFKLPIGLVFNKQFGSRYSLTFVQEGKEEVLNFYDGEQLYMHVDKGVLAVAVAKTQQEPSKIKQILKGLIKR